MGARKKSIPASLTLTVGDGATAAAVDRRHARILTVRDDAESPARGVSGAGPRHRRAPRSSCISPGIPGQEALGPLVTSRARSGSLHPLQTIVEPELAPARLKGAWQPSKACRAPSSRRADRAGPRMRPFRIATRPNDLSRGAVFASNYLVVVEAVAHGCCAMPGYRCRRLGGRCGPWSRERSRISAARATRGAHRPSHPRRYRDDRAAPAIAGGG